MDIVEIAISYILGIASAGLFIPLLNKLVSDRIHRPKIKIFLSPNTVTNEKEKKGKILNFVISVERVEKMLGDHVFVKINNIRYPWLERNIVQDEKKILVGEINWISPYYFKMSYVDDISKQQNVSNLIKLTKQSNHGLELALYELDSKKNQITDIPIFSKFYRLPKNNHKLDVMLNLLINRITITLISETIQQKVSYDGEIKLERLTINKLENGIPSLDLSDYELKLNLF